MYIQIYINRFIFLDTRIYVNMYECTYVHFYIYTHMHVHKYVYMYIYICTSRHIYIHIVLVCISIYVVGSITWPPQVNNLATFILLFIVFLFQKSFFCRENEIFEIKQVLTKNM